MKKRLLVASLIAAALFGTSTISQAAVKTWTGTTDGTWNTGANWGGAIPLTGDSLVFTSATGLGGLTLTDNLMTPATFSIAGITFSAGSGAYVINPNAGTNGFTLTGNVLNSSTNLQTINDLIATTAVRTFTMTTGGGNITLGGVVSGTLGGITTAGTGTLTLGATGNSYTGATTIASGTTLSLSGTLTGGTAIAVNGTGVLSQTSTGGISGGSTLTHSSSGTSTLAGTNTYTGATSISAGTINLTGSLAGTAITISGTGVLNKSGVGGITGGASITHTSSGTSTLGGTNSYTGATNISAGTLNLTGSLTGATAISVTGGNFTQSGTGVIGSAANTLAVNTAGTATLSGINTYTGATTVNFGGTLNLDFSGASAPTTANEIIKSGNTINLGGGTLTVKGGGVGATNTQTLGTTALTANTASTINVNLNGGTALNVAFGGFTRSAQSSVDITLPSSGVALTTTSSGGAGGILGNSNNVAYATANGGTTWLAKTGTTPFPLSALSTYSTTNANYLTGNNIDVTNGDAPAAGVTVNSLRFNAASTGLTLSGTNIITTGGILVPATGTGSTITGGTLTSSTTAAEVIVHDYSTLNIGSIIANANSGATATNVTFTGTGTTTLSAANSYTGITGINKGIVKLSGSGTLGNGTAPLTIANTGKLQLNGVSATVGALNNVITVAGTATPTIENANAANAVLNVSNGGTWSGLLQNGTGGGTLGLTLSGGTLNLNSANTYTGPTVISKGILAANNASALGASTNILTLGDSNTGANAVEFKIDTAVAATINLSTINTSNFGTSQTITINAGSALGANVNGFASTINFAGTVPLTIRATNTGGHTTAQDWTGRMTGTGIANGSTALTLDGTSATLRVTFGGTSQTSANTFTGDVIIKGPVTTQNTTFAGADAAHQNLGFLNNNVTAQSGTWTVVWGGETVQKLDGVGSIVLNNQNALNNIGLTVGNNNATGGSYSGAITGGFGVAKVGTGTQSFSGSNGYTGITSVLGGVLKLGSATAISGGINATGGTSAITINGGVVGLANGNFLRGLGTGVTQVQFTGSGGFAAYGAARNVNLGNALATATWASGSFIPNGSTFILSAADADNTVTFQNPINLANATRTIQVNDGSAGTDAALSNAISSTTAASGALTKTGAGTLEFNGTDANTYTGTTLISVGTLSLNKTVGVNAIAGNATVAGGTLSLAANDQIADSANVVVSSGAFAIGGSSDSVNGVQLTGGSITGSGGTLSSATAFDVQAGSVSAILGGGVGLTKTTAGTVTLSGTNTYSGDTTVNAGTLAVTGSLLNNGPASVFVVAPDTVKDLTDPKITRTVASGTNYATAYTTGLGSTAISNDPDVLMASMNTTAAIIGGTTTGTSDISMQWRARTSGEANFSNTNAVLSNVLNLNGVYDTGTPNDGILDTFVLQMSYTDEALGSLNETAIALSGELRLGWLDNGTWKSAFLGNNNGTGTGTYVGPYAYDPNIPAYNVLGAYGVDPANNVVWAVLNHNSEFAVIPEPSTLVVGGLALLGLAGVGLRRRRMAAK